MITKLRRLLQYNWPAWMVLVAAAVLGVLCYGILVPRLGFYWDDLAYQYAFHVFGAGGFKAYVALDRPFSHYLYIVTSTLFGTRPIFYQIFNLLLRFGCAAVAWWTLATLWPRHKTALAPVPLMMMIYPGFWQQPIAFIYNLHWINFLQTLLSLGVMILAVRAQQSGQKSRFVILTVAALVLSLNIFSLEYSFGLELLRPLLIFLVLSESIRSPRQKVKKTLAHWLPYLAVAALFLTWTLFLQNNGRYTPALLAGTTGSLPARIVELVQRVLQDLAQIALQPWLKLFDPLYNLQVSSTSALLFWAAALFTALLASFTLLRLAQDSPGPEDDEHDRWAKQAILVGVWALVPTGIPFWMVGISIETRFPFDRFTMPFLLGVGLLLTAVVELMVSTRARRIAVITILLSLAAGAQLLNTNTFRREWSNLGTFLWQMAWRAPALDPGTLLLTHDLPFTYYSDNSLTAILNQTYSPNKKNDPAMDYALLYTNDRLKGSLASLAPDTPYERNFRSMHFSGNTSRAIVLYYSPPGCLRLLDPSRPQEIPDVPLVYKDMLPISKIDRVKSNPEQAARPVPGWFPQPGDSWCKVFEQADLARQEQRWSDIVSAMEPWLAAHTWDADPTEYGVLIEAAARLDNLNGAQAYSEKLTGSVEGQQFVCREWDYLANAGLAGKNEREQRFPQLHCLAK